MMEPETPAASPPPANGVTFTVRAIGVAHTPLRRGTRIPRALRPIGRGIVEIFLPFVYVIEGLEVGCRAWLLTYCAGDNTEAPTNAGGIDRSTSEESIPASIHRFHPIGMNLVTLLGIEGRRLWVEGLEAEDGSPVLDIQRPKEDHRFDRPQHPCQGLEDDFRAHEIPRPQTVHGCVQRFL